MDFDSKDIESISSPMVVRTAASDRMNHIPFTESEIQMLVELAQMPHYQILLRLMHGEVEKAETQHFQNYLDQQKFDRLGVVAVSMRIFLERIQKEVAHMHQEFLGLLEDEQVSEQLAGITPEELIRRGVEGV